MSNNKIYQLYLDLLQKHGNPQKFWPNWCAPKKSTTICESIIIGTILTQQSSWRNVEQALGNLKKAKLLSLKKIAHLFDVDKLSTLIKPVGFYQTKPQRLFDLCAFIVKNYGNLKNFSRQDLGVARQKLLSLSGIGPETADSILLYAMEKPSFVIDEYTKRLVVKEKLPADLKYDSLKKLFEKNLPQDVKLYQDFHALIVIEGKGERGAFMNKF